MRRALTRGSEWTADSSCASARKQTRNPPKSGLLRSIDIATSHSTSNAWRNRCHRSCGSTCSCEVRMGHHLYDFRSTSVCSIRQIGVRPSNTRSGATINTSEVAAHAGSAVPGNVGGGLKGKRVNVVYRAHTRRNITAHNSSCTPTVTSTARLGATQNSPDAPEAQATGSTAHGTDTYSISTAGDRPFEAIFVAELRSFPG